MQDRPSREELLQGIVRFLESDLVPVLEEPLRFHTRVAANLLRIVARENAWRRPNCSGRPGTCVVCWRRRNRPAKSRETASGRRSSGSTGNSATR